MGCQRSAFMALMGRPCRVSSTSLACRAQGVLCSALYIRSELSAARGSGAGAGSGARGADGHQLLQAG